MTDFICHSSLPYVVLEKVALTSVEVCIYPRKKRRPCVYISTPLRYQQKIVRLVLEPLRKLALIHMRTTKAQISLRIRAD